MPSYCAPGTPIPPRGLALPWRFVDIIGDVHGCLPELITLLTHLGYAADDDGAWRHPRGRRLVFVGDLCNRGPDTIGVLELAAATVAAGQAVVVRGNHDQHVLRWLRGRIEARDGDLAATAAQYAERKKPERKALKRRHRKLLKHTPLWVLLDPSDRRGAGVGRRPADGLAVRSSTGHALLRAPRGLADPELAPDGDREDARVREDVRDRDDARTRARDRERASDPPAAFGADDARLVVAHAAWHPRIPRTSKRLARRWCLYGPTLARDETGRHPRLDWRRHYPQDAPYCVFGHTAFDGPVNARGATLCVDTACAYGGALTALRWPTRTVVRVPAQRTYYEHVDLREAPKLLDPDALDLGPAAAALARGAHLA